MPTTGGGPRTFTRIALIAICLGPIDHAAAEQSVANRPNIILCMADDLGWGDTAYNGHAILETPNLDAMSREGIRFDRFYAAAPVCSPTRASCLTGRHAMRMGIRGANSGHMRGKERTLAEVLKAQGYTTGHFGKWHLGTLTKTLKESNRGGPRGAAHYSPPWENGFDVCFSTEAKVPTFHPMNKPGTKTPYGTHYWIGPGRQATKNLSGDDSRIIMDRAIPFIEHAVRQKSPFFAVIWFHAPHKPVVAGPRHRALYESQPEEAQHYYGCITAMDEQIGRLRRRLRELKVDRNTMLWFCSDNGPEGRRHNGNNGSAGPFRGRKRSLFEGGIRVPALLVWPDGIRRPRVLKIPCSTSDYFPTVIDVRGLRLKDRPQPVDGISLLPWIAGRTGQRSTPIAFEAGKQRALIGDRYKLISRDAGENFMLFDLLEDRSEARDLAAEKPETVIRMRRELEEWRKSCEASAAGKDYLPE